MSQYQSNPLLQEGMVLLQEISVQDTTYKGNNYYYCVFSDEGPVKHLHICEEKPKRGDGKGPKKNKNSFECCLEFETCNYFNHDKERHMRMFNHDEKKDAIKFLTMKYGKFPTVWHYLKSVWDETYPKNKINRSSPPNYKDLPTIGMI